MTRFRRFALLLAFALWQGGFVFYAAVVVPVGTGLHGHFAQGLVTQRVTHGLNLAGLACHVLYFWELRAAGGRRWKWVLWGASLAALNALAFIHLTMDGLIDAGSRQTGDGFRGWHVAYLWLSTAQWAIGLALAWAAVHEPRPPGSGG